MAHAYHSAVFNVFRRCKNQFLYVVPPLLLAYALMSWAEEKYVFHFQFLVFFLGAFLGESVEKRYMPRETNSGVPFHHLQEPFPELQSGTDGRSRSK